MPLITSTTLPQTSRGRYPATDQGPLNSILTAVGKNVAEAFRYFPNTTSLDQIRQEKSSSKGGKGGKVNQTLDQEFRYLCFAPVDPGGRASLSTGRTYRVAKASRRAWLTGSCSRQASRRLRSFSIQHINPKPLFNTSDASVSTAAMPMWLLLPSNQEKHDWKEFLRRAKSNYRPSPRAWLGLTPKTSRFSASRQTF